MDDALPSLLCEGPILDRVVERGVAVGLALGLLRQVARRLLSGHAIGEVPEYVANSLEHVRTYLT